MCGEDMPRFFVDEINKDNIILDGENARHIGRSLRMKPGEPLTVCCKGIDYDCTVSSITGEQVFLELVSCHSCEAEPDIKVTLFQAVPKGDKLEQIVKKAVELGVSQVVPVLTRRCVSRPDEKDFSKKLQRLNKIAEEAAKQSGRGIIPEVLPIISYKTVLDMLPDFQRSVILYEAEGGCSFSQVDFSGAENIALIVGSEGGFELDEVQAAAECGAERVWLGKRILRCETAPITALSVLMFLTNNL